MIKVAGTSKKSSLPKLAGLIPSFHVGQLYRRRDEIHSNYGGSRQGGISKSAHCMAIFLFTGDSGEQYGYRDGYDDAGVFSYSGEGQIGDMVFKVGNKAVRDHGLSGHALHLFKSLGKGKKQEYLGEFMLANYSTRRGLDREGRERNVIVFHLMPVLVEPGAKDVSSVEESLPVPTSLDEARRLALEACAAHAGEAGVNAVRTLYRRSKAVRDYVLMRSIGVCEGCSKPAPFRDVKGDPYLEVHHTTRLSDGGLDHPEHVAALCPTCHRHVHYGEDGKSLNQMVMTRVLALEG